MTTSTQTVSNSLNRKKGLDNFLVHNFWQCQISIA